MRAAPEPPAYLWIGAAPNPPGRRFLLPPPARRRRRRRRWRPCRRHAGPGIRRRRRRHACGPGGVNGWRAAGAAGGCVPGALGTAGAAPAALAWMPGLRCCGLERRSDGALTCLPCLRCAAPPPGPPLDVIEVRGLRRAPAVKLSIDTRLWGRGSLGGVRAGWGHTWRPGKSTPPTPPPRARQIPDDDDYEDEEEALQSLAARRAAALEAHRAAELLREEGERGVVQGRATGRAVRHR